MAGALDLLALGLFFVVLQPVMQWLLFRRLRPEQKRVRWEITADRIVVRDGTGTTVELPWGVVRRVLERRSGFSVSVVPAGTRWMPKRVLAADDLPRFRALITRKLGAKGRHKA